MATKDTVDNVVTVAVCDGHPFVRVGIRATLEGDPGIAVVAEAADRAGVLRAVQRHRPSVVVAEHGLLGEAMLPNPNLVVLADELDGERSLALLRRNVRGLVLRSGPGVHLLSAVHAVAGGGSFVSPEFTQSLVATLRIAATPTRFAMSLRGVQLTQREREVLDLVCQGMANKEIAQRLRIGEKTVKFHVSNVLAKLQLRTRAQLIALVVKPAGSGEVTLAGPVTGGG